SGTALEWGDFIEEGATGLFASGTAAAPGIAFASDTNTGLYRPYSDAVSIATGGADRLFIDVNQTTVKNDLLVEGPATFELDAAPTYSSNLLDGVTFTLGPNWSGDVASGFTHTPGAADEVTFDFTTTADKLYILRLQTTAYTSGYIEVYVGGKWYDFFNLSTSYDFGLYTTTAEQFKIRASSDGDYTYLIQLLEITSYAAYNKRLKFVDEYATNSFFVSNKGIGIDKDCLAAGTTFTSGNVALGDNALKNIVYGNGNIAIGANALNKLGTGHGNIAIGNDALKSLHRVDYYTGYNFAIGAGALMNIEEGALNIAIGPFSGRYTADGTPFTNGSNGIYLGYGTRASANGVIYEIVIGRDNVGRGSYTTVIGHANGKLYSNGTIVSVQMGSAGTPAFTFDTDENTGIYHPADDMLAISTGGTERVRVDNNDVTLTAYPNSRDDGATITNMLHTSGTGVCSMLV
ncbi:MAG: hypothetical protein D6706_08395, partial [Chloroflexi bacterium]